MRSRCSRYIYIHRLYLKRNRRNVPWYWIARMHFRWATSYLLPFAYSLFVKRNSWTTLECCCPNLCGYHSQLSPAPLSVLASVRSEFGSLLFVGIAFIHSSLTLFNSPLTISANYLPSSQCPCSVIWFEEFLMGSCAVVLCPRSGEGYFGLARRTYSLQCLPDIAAVRLNRFTFRFCG